MGSPRSTNISPRRPSKAKPPHPKSAVGLARANVWNFIKAGCSSNRRRDKELQ
jgi:hypothetical protein